jgi:hypothetical protein
MTIGEAVIDVLRSQVTGNIVLLVAAVIGVGGNFWLWRRKRKHRRETLRVALLSEIVSMQPAIKRLDHQDPSEEITPEFFLSNNVYDGNAAEIGSLTEEEVASLVEFYTQASKLQAVAKREPGRVFVEASNRQVYSKLISAVKAIESNLNSEIRIGSTEFEPPLEPWKSETEGL